MKRRHFLFLAPFLPSALFTPRLLRAWKNQSPPPRNIAEDALRIDELASNIHTPADARRLIDFIAQIFSDELPPLWTTDSLRSRLAQGEYLAVTNPEKRIPEEHLATTWNAYITTIHAPETSQVTAAEIHNMRDALWVTARIMWSRGGRNFWAVPSIFATQPDGSLGSACRVVESLRILWDLANMPDNLRGARERMSNNMLMSDLYKRAQQKPPSSSAGRAYLSVGVSSNPVETAATQYIRDHGVVAFSNSVETMLNTLLPA
jgi:hypothetical protein